MTFVWVIIAVVVILALLAGDGKNKGRQTKAPDEYVRIDRPHVIDDDDFECSACHRRFRKNVMVCPYCGACFTARTEDTEEWDEEEDELEAWDEEDGV